ncbi:winged helix DNA-binding domain-containing protein [Clostridium sp. AM58-1XD]|uniref:winged helix DNA-binding domain-containing protein n=1 Tax=Clostridium sp. AM58-1XD TaxID=2292307 RepID=UPI000E4952F3|nr:winged helix DNA-binding domain-containing protein [Clostridium sp. AM58-1XD]RGZ01466.1 winged helix DNA-binding domain-containing protein [Clostridium sp. AM58-1XD]
MNEPGIEKIRSFRLHSHHLDSVCQNNNIMEIAGACGLQNSPPGAWETALYNRVPGCSLAEMEYLLYEEKSLLQAWSLRGVPIVFPTQESGVFLAALAAEKDEPWIYTQGISLALDFLHMDFDDLLILLEQVIPQLDEQMIVSKSSLDQVLAEWMLPLLPLEKRGLWNQPSMYGNPDVQTVGGAVVSFMLRPCAFQGLVVFGERKGVSPSFTSYRGWTGCTFNESRTKSEKLVQKLVRKYLHCYGPATVDTFISWLGCSGKQGRRMWNTVSEEIEAVTVNGKKAFILSADRERLFSPASFDRELLLLGGHDPFLDQRDRMVLQPDRSRQRQIWKFTANPGAVLYRGEIIGIWTNKKKGRGMEVNMTLWTDLPDEPKLIGLAEEYAAFRRQKLASIQIRH